VLPGRRLRDARDRSLALAAHHGAPPPGDERACRRRNGCVDRCRACCRSRGAAHLRARRSRRLTPNELTEQKRPSSSADVPLSAASRSATLNDGPAGLTAARQRQDSEEAARKGRSQGVGQRRSRRRSLSGRATIRSRARQVQARPEGVLFPWGRAKSRRPCHPRLPPRRRGRRLAKGRRCCKPTGFKVVVTNQQGDGEGRTASPSANLAIARVSNREHPNGAQITFQFKRTAAPPTKRDGAATYVEILCHGAQSQSRQKKRRSPIKPAAAAPCQRPSRSPSPAARAVPKRST